MSLEICYEEGRLKVAVNEENTPWNLTSYPSPIEDVIAALKMQEKKENSLMQGSTAMIDMD